LAALPCSSRTISFIGMIPFLAFPPTVVEPAPGG